jgi:hypothetical protein
VWDAITSAFEWSSLKTGQGEIKSKIHADLKKWAKLLLTFTKDTSGIGSETDGDVQLHLIKQVQTWFYNNVSLQRNFLEAIHELYVCEILDEDAILVWYEGKNTDLQTMKGRDLFKENLTPFIQWLNIAEEESDKENEKLS